VGRAQAQAGAEVIGARILGTGSALPDGRRSTVELARRALPERDPVEVARKVGIDERRWLAPDEEAADLAARALAQALDGARLHARDLRRVIFVSSTGGDRLIPATANDLLARLGLDDDCDAFDLNNSCAGFLSALDVAARTVATGVHPVAVVAAESFSRYLSPSVPRSWLVLGDAAAAVVLGPSTESGLLASHLRNSAELRGMMATPHPGRTGRVEHLEFQASHEELLASAILHMRRAAKRVLDEARLSLDDVRWFLPHQPNGHMLDHILADFAIDRERAVDVVREAGSVGAASLALSLDRLLRTRPVRAGDRALLLGVGGGTAYGAILYQWGAR